MPKVRQTRKHNEINGQRHERAERDPNGIGQHELGAKLDADKPDASLLGEFGLALLEVARVGTVGAKKYSRGSWQHVDDGTTRYTAAMLRHFFTENAEQFDSDTGMLHAAQVAWNALARLELMIRETKSSSNTFSKRNVKCDS